MKSDHKKILLSVIVLSLSILGFYLFFQSDDEFNKRRQELQYFNSKEYQSLLGREKIELLWKEVLKDRTSFGYYPLSKLLMLFVQDNSITFKHKGDVFPLGRNKLVHTNGVISKAEFKITNKNKYSGLFRSESSSLLLRLSAAKPYNPKKSTADEAYRNFAPGIALKFLIDGRNSENLVAMFDTMGQKSWNFFKNTFTNNFKVNENPDIMNILLAQKFCLVTNSITAVGLKGISSYTEDGKAENSIVFPFRLEFIPNPDLKLLFSDNFTLDYKDILMNIQPGTLIYSVYAIDEPGCEPEKIGEIITKSEFTTSRFSDEHLFFRHGLVDEDDLEFEGRNKERDFYSFFGGMRKGTEPKKANKKCPIGFT